MDPRIREDDKTRLKATQKFVIPNSEIRHSKFKNSSLPVQKFVIPAKAGIHFDQKNAVKLKTLKSLEQTAAIHHPLHTHTLLLQCLSDK